MKRAAALRIVLDHCLSTGGEAVRAAAAVLEPKPTDSAPGVSERGLAFAEWFRSTLAADAHLASGWSVQWARCFDDLLRLDGRTPEQIAAVCQWARTHDFWRANFQTPLKLRQRKDGVMYFDRFAAAMKGGRGTTRRVQSRGYEMAPCAAPRAVSASELLKGGFR